MPAGGTIWFDDGVFQIDAEVRVATLAFRTSYAGPFTANTGPFVSVGYYFDIAVPSNVRSLFFSSDTPVFVALWSKVGTTWRFKVSAQVALRIYGFADQEIVPSTSGLQFFSEAGVLTFDSDSNFLRVSGISRNAGPGTSVPWPSTSRRFAAGLGHFPKRGVGAAQAGVPYWVQMSYGITVGPSSCTVGELPISSRPTGGGGTPPPPNSPPMAAPTMMIVDVTNFD